MPSDPPELTDESAVESADAVDHQQQVASSSANQDDKDEEEDAPVKPKKVAREIVEDLREHLNIIFIGYVGKNLFS